MTEVPRFAVVGRVNKGKSSIVATLAEDDSVRIDPRPGTTTEVREYPVQVDGRTLFVLVDTPGFEDAPRALAWLRARPGTAAERPARVADLVRAHQGTDDFVDERRLLAPVLEGASILYVVDGTRPYRPNYEAEMEILRWTGRPGMALVNRIGPGDHAAEWHLALGQYFRIVRDFDAFSASFEERLHLLEAFRALRPEWRQPLEEAVVALGAQRRRRRAEAAATIGGLLVEALTHVEEVAVADQSALEAERDRLERSFHDALRALEERARRRVEAIYGHAGARFEEAGLERPVFRQDLFAEETWRLLGLSPAQLVGASALAGAAVGGAVDVAVGGASFMAGAVIGGALAGGTALYGLGRRFARARRVGPGGVPGLVRDVRGLWSGGPRFRVGPHAQPNFPWVLLDRALLHYDAVARRTHARRGRIPTAEGAARAGLVTGFAREERRELEAIFRRLRRDPDDPDRELCNALERALARVLRRVDPVPGEGATRPAAEAAPGPGPG
jgi:small GTP-binding protein